MKSRVIIVVTIAFLFFGFNFAFASFLEEEAGISASTKVSTVDIEQAATAFKNIEKRTASYIIGSVAIDGYEERYDVHVYVDVSGDMVAYYLKSEPASKIIDWMNYSGGAMTLEGCKLEDALTKVCNAMLQSLPPVTYFDFRFPEAQKIEIIIDEETTNNDTVQEHFRINIPSNHAVYNCSWSHGVFRNAYLGSSPDLFFALDGVNLHFITSNVGYLMFNDWVFWEGEVELSSLLPDMYHEFTLQGFDSTGLESYAAIVLIYSEGQ